MAIELMTKTRKKLLLLLVMCILAVSAMGAANVTTELVQQPTEKARAMQQINQIAGLLADETSPSRRGAWRQLANAEPITFMQACASPENP
ncbi:MAG: hypothetical protein R6V56_05130 [Lentisphaeria bacterium]